MKIRLARQSKMELKSWTQIQDFTINYAILASLASTPIKWSKQQRLNDITVHFLAKRIYKCLSLLPEICSFCGFRKAGISESTAKVQTEISSSSEWTLSVASHVQNSLWSSDLIFSESSQSLHTLESRSTLPNRNIMWATYVILNFLVAIFLI